MYRVTQYVGDYPTERQLFWKERFYSLKAANFVAKNIWNAIEWMVTDDHYILIEKYKDEDSIGTPLVVYMCDGPIRLKAMDEFLSILLRA